MKFGKKIVEYNNNLISNDTLMKYDINFCRSTVKYKILKHYLKNIKPLDNLLNFNNDICSICLDKIEKDYIQTVCKHFYHPKCFIDLLSSCDTYCPLCRTEIALPIIDETNEYDNNMKYIIKFLSMIKVNINFINKSYLNITKKIKNNYWSNDKEFNEIIKILDEWKKYNYEGIKKILKKFKKFSSLDCSNFISYINFNVSTEEKNDIEI